MRSSMSVGLIRCCLVAFLFLLASSSEVLSQRLGLDEIRDMLRANPPGVGQMVLREEAILNLDEYLRHPNAPGNLELRDFHGAMIDSLAYELAVPVPSGARIWQMYNHGFIVKTSSRVLAFDLVDFFWGSPPIPDEALQQIQVGFVSHTGNDHVGSFNVKMVREFGVEFVAGQSRFPPGSHAIVRGLNVAPYDGLHGGVPNNIYHVTTPDGVTVMHTGDTQRSRDLPNDVPTDILLINAWMNESGSQSATQGVRNGVNRVAPNVTIPGHIQELGHSYVPGDPRSRVPYAWPLAVDDVPIPGELAVMVWGEHYDYNVEPTPVVHASAGAVYTVRDDDSDDSFDGAGDVAKSAFARDRVSIGEVDSATSNWLSRLVVKFALPEISPEFPILQSATLRLFVEDVDGKPAGPLSVLHSVTDNDLASLSSHYEDSSYRDTLPDLYEPGAETGTYYELDVTNLVLADYAADGAQPLTAFRLQIDNCQLIEDDQGNRIRVTMPHADANGPEIVLRFIPEPSTVVLATLALLWLGLLSWRRDGR